MLLSVRSYIRSTRSLVLRSQQSSRFQAATRGSDTSQNLKRLDEFRVLLQECVKLASDTGIKVGVLRTLQLVSASTKLTSEFINKPEQFLTKENTPSFPKILRRLFEELGATYVKLGQFIASSPTLFPAEYVLEFQSCLDRSPTVPFPTVKRIIQSELGTRDLNKYFKSIETTPVASASIAQVCKYYNVNIIFILRIFHQFKLI